ncbi:cell division protein FtsA [Campylobacter fetus]|uniref:Cell division protein FtsA n=3 Tax=Campylobacter fetus TaxID=196 RepID=A0A5L4KDJ1_CAMFE|nr:MULTISPECIES: cell division protein FtsA [Campylobacter]OCS26066.1 cell division protein FtsA [Campylobacter fetus subsp. venerealis cfvB10]OCS29424.1 cell division protein FtsA [Campylobacter fetus subsp. venerealis LMG 6570 = CCUG 33900]ABK81842.1 cell division protein FtsA [Campylobacter fetus subsp. fetus 82-40]AIR80267.1 cell division protein FtsA [Campylobacter fetus subsp. venerealis 97/608]EAI3886923.1 cell division protein FtsA [Campylobacter fetus]
MGTKILGIDIGSTQICAIMAECENSSTRSDNAIKVIGMGSVKSQGLKKGSITNIELASNSIKAVVNDVMRIAGTKFDKVIVSISGKDAKNIDCKDVINIPEREVNIKQIERAISSAEYKVKIPHDYEIIHTLPYNFKIDEQDNIEDPLGMNGTRLEVQAHIIVVQKSAVMNLRKAIEKAGLKADNIVLSGYASAIATLNEDEKALGAVLIDMGGASCNMVIHSGNSIRYNEFLGVGSSNITIDLSTILHTPPTVAEDIKVKYGTLKNQGNELIVLPDLGDENSSHEVDISVITKVIYMRVEETLMILAKMLSESNYKDLAGAGVVLTGGMTKLDGLRELASAVFDSMPVRIARPREFESSIDVFKDPANSCAIGLCLYGAGYFTPYEIDSERKLRYKDEPMIKNRGLISVKEMDEKRDQVLHSDTKDKFDKDYEIYEGIEDEISINTQNNDLKGIDLKIENDDSIKNDVGAKRIDMADSINPFSKFINYLKNLF